MKAWTAGDPAYASSADSRPARGDDRLPVLLPAVGPACRRAPTTGLYQTSTGGSPPMTLSGAVPGIAMYKENHVDPEQPGGHVLRQHHTVVLLVRRHELLQPGELAAVDPGQGELPALQRVRGRDDVLALRPGSGCHAVQHRGHGRQRIRPRVHPAVDDATHHGTADVRAPVNGSRRPPRRPRPRLRRLRRPRAARLRPGSRRPRTPVDPWSPKAATSTTANYWSSGADPATHHAQYAEWTDNGTCGPTTPPTTAPPTTAPPR